VYIHLNSSSLIQGAVRRKLSEKWITSSRFILDDNTPAHRSVLVKDLLPKNDVTTLEHLPCPDWVQRMVFDLSSDISIKGMALL
jgi:hypothetical protein